MVTWARTQDCMGDVEALADVVQQTEEVVGSLRGVRRRVDADASVAGSEEEAVEDGGGDAGGVVAGVVGLQAGGEAAGEADSGAERRW